MLTKVTAFKLYCPQFVIKYNDTLEYKLILTAQ